MHSWTQTTQYSNANVNIFCHQIRKIHFSRFSRKSDKGHDETAEKQFQHSFIIESVRFDRTHLFHTDGSCTNIRLFKSRLIFYHTGLVHTSRNRVLLLSQPNDTFALDVSWSSIGVFISTYETHMPIATAYNLIGTPPLALTTPT